MMLIVAIVIGLMGLIKPSNIYTIKQRFEWSR